MTIHDIAKVAGVSKSTVSLVLNNNSKVKLETRIKVQKIIDEMGYVPNMAARELITNNTNRIGLIFLSANNVGKPYAFQSVVETLLYDISNGIAKGLENTEYALLTERFSVQPGKQSLPRLINNRRVDGIFLIGGLFQSDFIGKVKKRGIPAVIVGRHHDSIDSVAVDYEKVGYLGAKHLIETGHKEIVFINGPSESANSENKLKGFKKALAEAKLSYGEEYVRYSDYTGKSAYEAIKQILASGIRPDSIFGGSDGISMGIMRFLYEKQLRIPEDISILGYEDSILAEHAAPALTTIDADKERIGEVAWEVLLNRIQKPKANVVSLTIDPRLNTRDSVKLR